MAPGVSTIVGRSPMAMATVRFRRVSTYTHRPSARVRPLIDFTWPKPIAWIERMQGGADEAVLGGLECGEARFMGRRSDAPPSCESVRPDVPRFAISAARW